MHYFLHQCDTIPLAFWWLKFHFAIGPGAKKSGTTVATAVDATCNKPFFSSSEIPHRSIVTVDVGIWREACLRKVQLYLSWWSSRRRPRAGTRGPLLSLWAAWIRGAEPRRCGGPHPRPVDDRKRQETEGVKVHFIYRRWQITLYFIHPIVSCWWKWN